MLRAGDVVSYLEMCAPFGVNLQRGMNFRLRNSESLILMSLRRGAPYEDRVEQGGGGSSMRGPTVHAFVEVPIRNPLTNPNFSPMDAVHKTDCSLMQLESLRWVSPLQREYAYLRKFETVSGSTTDYSN